MASVVSTAAAANANALVHVNAAVRVVATRTAVDAIETVIEIAIASTGGVVARAIGMSLRLRPQLSFVCSDRRSSHRSSRNDSGREDRKRSHRSRSKDRKGETEASKEETQPKMQEVLEQKPKEKKKKREQSPAFKIQPEEEGEADD